MASLWAGALMGCQAMTPPGAGPASAGSSISAQKEPSVLGESSDTMDEAPGVTTPTPPAPLPANPSSDATGSANANAFGGPSSIHHDLFAAAGDPQAGGVSALPGAVEGGKDSKTAFDFTLTGSAQPVCTDPEPEISALSKFPRIHYLVRGVVGAVLLDGTAVPLNGCEVVTLRFQTGSGSMVRCQDISVKADCSLFGSVKLRSGEKPKIYFLTTGSQSDDCEDMEDAQLPATNDLTFLQSSGKLSECGPPPTINDSILSHPNLKSKFVK